MEGRSEGSAAALIAIVQTPASAARSGRLSANQLSLARLSSHSSAFCFCSVNRWKAVQKDRRPTLRLVPTVTLYVLSFGGGGDTGSTFRT
ncbi:hypothetical protein Ddye_031859 [Dipteronia dyeriana]|uniref:Uncharacterized protein n=1 Tax=Dipteronia dyeriana TaxID=168575 RepID=A0AAD9WNV4_9ROSI|nr:hypothetical protein Ddye_031859 [Dipteronia dyeriana]